MTGRAEAFTAEFAETAQCEQPEPAVEIAAIENFQVPSRLQRNIRRFRGGNPDDETNDNLT